MINTKNENISKNIEYIYLNNVKLTDDKTDKIFLSIGYLAIFTLFFRFLLYWLPNYAKENNANTPPTIREELNLGVDILYKNDSVYLLEKKIDTIYKEGFSYSFKALR